MESREETCFVDIPLDKEETPNNESCASSITSSNCPAYDLELKRLETEVPPEYDEEETPPRYNPVSFLFGTNGSGSELYLNRSRKYTMIYCVVSLIISITMCIFCFRKDIQLNSYIFLDMSRYFNIINCVTNVGLFIFSILRKFSSTFGTILTIKTVIQFFASLSSCFTLFLASLSQNGSSDFKLEHGGWFLLILLPIIDFIVIFCLSDYVRKFLK